MRPSLAVTSAALTLAACSAPSLKLGSDTQGDTGAMRFHYSSSQCVFGCALDRPVALGSMITVQATGGDASVRYGMRLEPAEVGTLTMTESCFCERRTSNGGSGRAVDPSGDCGAGESKACTRIANIETLAPGDAKLVVIDPGGKAVDAVGFAIRAVERIEATVKINEREVKAGADGTFAARPGDVIAVHSVLYGAGKPMVFTQHGLIPSYSNPKVLDSAGEAFGATDVEDAAAKGPGTATLTMRAHGADFTATIRVAD